MKLYKYLAIGNQGKIFGYLLADSKIEAALIMKESFLLIIYIRRAWFFTFNIYLVVKWFSALNNLLKSGFDIKESLKLVSKHFKINVSLSILYCLRMGQSFNSAICKNIMFFGRDSYILAKYLGEYITVENLCKFLEEYNTFVMNNFKQARKIMFLPALSLCCCVMVFFVILYMLAQNVDVILNFFKNENLLWIKVLSLIKSLGLIPVFCVFCAFVLILIKFFILKSKFVQDYYLNKEAFFVFYVLNQYMVYGLHLINCFDVMLRMINNGIIYKDITLIKKSLVNGQSLHKSFSGCTYLSKYTDLVAIYEQCGKIDELFAHLFKIENDEFLEKLNFISNYLPLAFLIMSGLVLVLLCWIVFFNIMNFDFWLISEGI